MNSDLKKFEELMRTDPAFQEKLRVAVEKYDGDKTSPEAIFNGVLVPLGKEYGLSATYEEFQEYMKSLTKLGELSDDELEQVAGGKGGGVGGGFCLGIGAGLGGGGGSDDRSPANGFGCALLGVGFGGVGCFGSGEPVHI